jgi:hypothetical protein
LQTGAGGARSLTTTIDLHVALLPSKSVTVARTGIGVFEQPNTVWFRVMLLITQF